MQPHIIFQSWEFNLMFLWKADGIAATRTTTPAWPILSRYLKQITVLLLVTGSGEFCLWTVDAVIILILNLSRNRSVGKDLYKWSKISTRAQLLGQGRKKVNVFKKVVAPSFKITVGEKKGTPVCNQNGEAGKNICNDFEIWNRFKEYRDPISFWCPTTFTSWPTEKNTVMTVFIIFALIKLLLLCYFIVLRVIW